MRNKLLAAGAVVVALGLGSQAQANEMVDFSLSGAGISGYGSMTVTPDMIANDPVGANNIIGVSGYFSDANAGIFNEAITGLMLTNPTPQTLATSLTRFDVPSATVLPADDSDSLTYDNLFYPDGSPDTCDDGSAGGFLDVFGALMTLANGDVVNVWSNGSSVSVPNDSAMYGIAVAGLEENAETALDYRSSGLTMTAPEPGSLWVLGTALLGILGLSRRSRDSGPASPALG